MDISKGALNRIGVGTISRQIQELKAGMSRHPVLHFLGFMEFCVIDHDGELHKEWGRMGAIKGIEQLKQQPGLFAIPHYNG